MAPVTARVRRLPSLRGPDRRAPRPEDRGGCARHARQGWKSRVSVSGRTTSPNVGGEHPAFSAQETAVSKTDGGACTCRCGDRPPHLAGRRRSPQPRVLGQQGDVTLRDLRRELQDLVVAAREGRAERLARSTAGACRRSGRAGRGSPIRRLWWTTFGCMSALRRETCPRTSPVVRPSQNAPCLLI